MAKTTRKKKQEPEKNIGVEIFESLRELEATKGIPVDYMVDRMKQALINAYRKNPEGAQGHPAEHVDVELSEKGLYMFQVKKVVEDVWDAPQEIHIDAARKLQPDCRIGDSIRIPINIESFSRIAAKNAKSTIIQGIREAESGAKYQSYSSKAQELLMGTVLRVEPDGEIIIHVGTGPETGDAVLRVSEQIPGETYVPGDTIRVYVLDVRRSNRGPMIHVSRTHPNLVRRLFELETPEIANGEVEVRNIAREAGSRSKMAVRAAAEGVDPVGACVGPHGDRVGAVVNQLHGEKIDIVVYSEDPCEYVKAALSPADVISVSVVPGQKICKVVVPDDQLSLAIGKEGQNARLAARLTSYKIDIKPASQAEEPAAPAEL